MGYRGNVKGEKNLSFSYDNNGNTTAENTKQYIYNQNQRLTQVTDTKKKKGDGSEKRGRFYFIDTRDNIGNITGIIDNLVPLKNKTYSYDNLHRLTLATGQWGAITYAYGSVGNRTYETTDTGNTTYSYTVNTNKLASTTGEKNLTFSYDNNGNTTTENTRQYI
jgi:hypothetical protein